MSPLSAMSSRMSLLPTWIAIADVLNFWLFMLNNQVNLHDWLDFFIKRKKLPLTPSKSIYHLKQLRSKFCTPPLPLIYGNEHQSQLPISNLIMIKKGFVLDIVKNQETTTPIFIYSQSPSNFIMGGECYVRCKLFLTKNQQSWKKKSTEKSYFWNKNDWNYLCSKQIENWNGTVR